MYFFLNINMDFYRFAEIFYFFQYKYLNFIFKSENLLENLLINFQVFFIQIYINERCITTYEILMEVERW